MDAILIKNVSPSFMPVEAIFAPPLCRKRALDDMLVLM